MSVDIHKGIQDGMRRNAYKSDDLGAFFKVRSPLPLFDNHNTSKSNILKFKILISKWFFFSFLVCEKLLIRVKTQMLVTNGIIPNQLFSFFVQIVNDDEYKHVFLLLKIIKKHKGKIPKRKNSKYVGVRLCTQGIDLKYLAQYTKKRKTISIGRYDNENDAATAYDEYIRLHKINAGVNFPKKGETVMKKKNSLIYRTSEEIGSIHSVATVHKSQNYFCFKLLILNLQNFDREHDEVFRPNEFLCLKGRVHQSNSREVPPFWRFFGKKGDGKHFMHLQEWRGL